MCQTRVELTIKRNHLSNFLRYLIHYAVFAFVEANIDKQLSKCIQPVITEIVHKLELSHICTANILPQRGLLRFSHLALCQKQLSLCIIRNESVFCINYTRTYI